MRTRRGVVKDKRWWHSCTLKSLLLWSSQKQACFETDADPYYIFAVARLEKLWFWKPGDGPALASRTVGTNARQRSVDRRQTLWWFWRFRICVAVGASGDGSEKKNICRLGEGGFLCRPLPPVVSRLFDFLLTKRKIIIVTSSQTVTDL